MTRITYNFWLVAAVGRRKFTKFTWGYLRIDFNWHKFNWFNGFETCFWLILDNNEKHNVRCLKHWVLNVFDILSVPWKGFCCSTCSQTLVSKSKQRELWIIIYVVWPFDTVIDSNFACVRERSIAPKPITRMPRKHQTSKAVNIDMMRSKASESAVQRVNSGG